MTLTDSENAAYGAVKEIQEMKHDSGLQPDYAMLYEVYNFLRPELPNGFEQSILESLRMLYRRGLIVFHKSVNGIPMFGVKE